MHAVSEKLLNLISTHFCTFIFSLNNFYSLSTLISSLFFPNLFHRNYISYTLIKIPQNIYIYLCFPSNLSHMYKLFFFSRLIRKQFFSFFFQMVKSLLFFQSRKLSPPKKYLSIFSRKNKFTPANGKKRKA